MADKTFTISDKAKELFVCVFDSTTSRNHYPVRFKRLADRMQEFVLDIYCNVTDANSIQANTQNRKDKRYDLQTHVIADCDKILTLVEYSYCKHMISGKTCEIWSGLIKDIKYMTLSWRSKNN